MAEETPSPTLTSLQRYERDVEMRQGGHYGEEQWPESIMRPCETGAWVKWSDVLTALRQTEGRQEGHTLDALAKHWGFTNLTSAEAYVERLRAALSAGGDERKA